MKLVVIVSVLLQLNMIALNQNNDNPIFKVSMSSSDEVFLIEEDITLTTTVKNISNHPATFCKFHTPFEGIMNDIFDVNFNGEVLPYLGPMVSRIGPDPVKDFIALKPGESVECSVTLNGFYNLKVAGEYTFRFTLSLDGDVYPSNLVVLNIVEKETSPFEVKLATSKATYKMGENVVVSMTVKNTGDSKARFCRYHTPFEGIANNIFSVTQNGDHIPYQGILKKRIPPTEKDYYTLAPGQVLSCEVTIEDEYDFKEKGQYVVQFIGSLIGQLPSSNEILFEIE